MTDPARRQAARVPALTLVGILPHVSVAIVSSDFVLPAGAGRAIWTGRGRSGTDSGCRRSSRTR